MCQCACGCRRRPAITIVCHLCGRGVGPGCCWVRACCHVCGPPPVASHGAGGTLMNVKDTWFALLCWMPRQVWHWLLELHYAKVDYAQTETMPHYVDPDYDDMERISTINLIKEGLLDIGESGWPPEMTNLPAPDVQPCFQTSDWEDEAETLSACDDKDESFEWIRKRRLSPDWSARCESSGTRPDCCPRAQSRPPELTGHHPVAWSEGRANKWHQSWTWSESWDEDEPDMKQRGPYKAWQEQQEYGPGQKQQLDELLDVAARTECWCENHTRCYAGSNWSHITIRCGNGHNILRERLVNGECVGAVRPQ